LFGDIRHTEQQYFKKTDLFPIMHAVAVRTDAVGEMPWLPAAILMDISGTVLKITPATEAP
jgi:4,5-dihydroxyphthalate decarboxylase